MLCSAAREETPAGINGGLRASCPMGQVRRTARRGRRPAVERSGTNALGVRRPVSAAAPRCKAPAGRGCRRRRLGKRNCRAISLPPSALRAATSLAEGGKGKRIPTPVCALARNDRSKTAGRCGHRPLRNGRKRGGQSCPPLQKDCQRAPLRMSSATARRVTQRSMACFSI